MREQTTNLTFTGPAAMTQTAIETMKKLGFSQYDESPEGFTYSAELEAQDPFFNRATQAELARRIKDIDAGQNIIHKTMEELEAMANG